VEAGFEGEDGHVWRAWGLVVHRRGNLLGGEVDIGSSTLLSTLPHKSSFVCGFVGVRAGHCREDLVKTLWCDSEDTSSEYVRPIVLGKVA